MSGQLYGSMAALGENFVTRYTRLRDTAQEITSKRQGRQFETIGEMGWFLLAIGLQIVAGAVVFCVTSWRGIKRLSGFQTSDPNRLLSVSLNPLSSTTQGSGDTLISPTRLQRKTSWSLVGKPNRGNPEDSPTLETVEFASVMVSALTSPNVGDEFSSSGTLRRRDKPELESVSEDLCKNDE